MYRTSQAILSDASSEEENESRRWLNFWLVFSGFQLAEGIGAGSIPGFYAAEAATLLSMYSVEHAVVVTSLIPRVCRAYIDTAHKAQRAWESQTATLALNDQQRGLLSAGWAKAQSLGGSIMGLFSSRSTAVVAEKED